VSGESNEIGYFKIGGADISKLITGYFKVAVKIFQNCR
jgi:hypothetical protein